MHIRRFKASEVVAVKLSQEKDTFRFPLAEGILQQPGADRHKAPRMRLRRSSSDRGNLVEVSKYPEPNTEKGEDSSEEEYAPSEGEAADPAPAPIVEPDF